MTETGWSADRAVETMAAAGAFGRGSRFVSFNLDSRHGGQDQFASTVFYGTVTVTDGGDGTDHRHHRLVIKIKHRSPELRSFLKNDSQFGNEILFYERIMPFLVAGVPTVAEDRVPSLCRYFFGRNDCGDFALQDLIVLENVNHYGYRPVTSGHRLFLDFDHLVSALRTLARFHGLSYRAKHTNRAEFTEMLVNVEETQWDSEGEWLIRSDNFGKLMNVIVDELVKRCDGEHDERLIRFRAELLADARQTLRNTMKPVEPWAVLCHGDFNRNNMLFRYENDGRPADALMFDMATVRYGSPALDLSFFLYMNTDHRTRDAHWDELLDAYCAALSASVSDLAGAVRVPDRVQLDTEFRQCAFYGLSHVLFFIRIMLEEQKPMNFLELIDMDENKIFEVLLSFGGDKATEAIADVTQHFIDLRYTDDVLNSS